MRPPAEPRVQNVNFIPGAMGIFIYPTHIVRQMYAATISASIGWLMYIGLGLVALGAAGVVFSLVYRIRRKDDAARRKAIGLLVTFAILASSGLPIYIIEGSAGGNATINIGSGYLQFNGPFLGNYNYSSNDVKYAFVENINSGCVTLGTRTDGTSLGNLNEGHFDLSNGQAAYVVSDNATSLVIEMASGPWVVLGTNNTMELASAFNSNVAPVSGI